MTISVETQKILREMINVLGENATEEQQDYLVGWIIYHIGRDYWGGVKQVLSMYDLDHAYTELDMRQSECGVY